MTIRDDNKIESSINGKVFASANCDVCGSECLYAELSTYELSSFGAMKVCPECVSRQGIDKVYRNANAMLGDIISIAINSDEGAEQRLEVIKQLLRGKIGSL
jgi:hypothetical protein